MARVEGRPTVKLEIVLVLTEEEAGALDALSGYGADQFLKAFYEQLGRSYMEPYAGGIRSLFKSIRELVSPHLETANEARKVFSGEGKTP